MTKLDFLTSDEQKELKEKVVKFLNNAGYNTNYAICFNLYNHEINVREKETGKIIFTVFGLSDDNFHIAYLLNGIKYCYFHNPVDETIYVVNDDELIDIKKDKFLKDFDTFINTAEFEWLICF